MSPFKTTVLVKRSASDAVAVTVLQRAAFIATQVASGKPYAFAVRKWDKQVGAK